jgi:cytochrome c peroxidase
MTGLAAVLAAGLVAGLSLLVPDDDPTAMVLQAADVELALEFSPLPELPGDLTNAVADDPAAARLGQALFFDERLSGPGTVSCSTCHDPARGWGDGRRLAKAVAHHPRHTMTLWNVAYNRWFFWDGRKDTLWSQALGPLEDPREHAASRLQVLHVITNDRGYVRAFADVFGPLPDLSDAARFPATGRPVPGEDAHEHAVAWASMTPADQELVNTAFVQVGKAIAAYERRIVSRRAPFDVFVEGLRTGDAEAQRAISPAAQRGFALFAGKAQCLICHDGPRFTDREFHTNRVPTGEGVDPGRALGIVRLLADPFNRASVYADDEGQSARTALSFPRIGWELPGSFKTPTLRNVATTAPYMHEGQIATLQDVVEFYSTLAGAAAPGQHDEKIIRQLDLTTQEKADLVAFLESLTDEGLAAEFRVPPNTPYLP